MMRLGSLWGAVGGVLVWVNAIGIPFQRAFVCGAWPTCISESHALTVTVAGPIWLEKQLLSMITWQLTMNVILRTPAGFYGVRKMQVHNSELR